jgi:hypothetical protein
MPVKGVIGALAKMLLKKSKLSFTIIFRLNVRLGN